MSYLYVVIRSVISAVVLFLLTKWMGQKQISQLNMFDYTVGITIGSIAADMAINTQENDWIFCNCNGSLRCNRSFCISHYNQKV